MTLTSATTCKVVVKYLGGEHSVSGTNVIKESRPTGDGINIQGTVTTTKGALGLPLAEGEDKKDEIEIRFWAPARPR